MNPNDLPPIDTTKCITDTSPNKHRHIWLAAGAIVATLIVGAIIYIATALSPVDRNSTDQIRFVVQSGDTASDVARALHQLELIRDPIVFQLYSEVTGTKSSILAGGYMLRKSESLSDIVRHLTSGKTDEVAITVLPGFSLHQLADPEFEGSLAAQGFSQQEITDAFERTYDSPLFAGAPAGVSLEGYIFPETYNMLATDSLERVLELSFDEFYSQIEEKNIPARLQQQGLTLREGIILASIVQKEVSDPEEQRQVAQVFLKRLREDIVLGSDVTFLYIAEKEGRTPSVNDESPYNTRKYGGLPPGPISNFNLSSLEAVASPAEGEYLYFVAGDDGTTHFSFTEEEHIENTRKYCTNLCE